MTTDMMHMLCNLRADADVISGSTCPQMIVHIRSLLFIRPVDLQVLIQHRSYTSYILKIMMVMILMMVVMVLMMKMMKTVRVFVTNSPT